MLKKILSSVKKNTLSNNIESSVFENLNSVGKVKDVSKDEKDILFDQAYNNGLHFLRLFTENIDNKDNLQKGLDFMLKANEINKNRGEPYYYMAHIAYIVNDISLSKDYFKMADFLKPNVIGLQELKNKIYLGG